MADTPRFIGWAPESTPGSPEQPYQWQELTPFPLPDNIKDFTVKIAPLVGNPYGELPSTLELPPITITGTCTVYLRRRDYWRYRWLLWREKWPARVLRCWRWYWGMEG